jgi:hypothetical protein
MVRFFSRRNEQWILDAGYWMLDTGWLPEIVEVGYIGRFLE